METILHTTTLSLLLAGGLFAQDPFAQDIPTTKEINPDTDRTNQLKVDIADAPKDPFISPGKLAPNILTNKEITPLTVCPNLADIDVVDEHQNLSLGHTMSLDGWTPARLKEAGITIRTLDNKLHLGQAIGVKQLEISFDCSKLEDYQPVFMNMQVVGKDRQMISDHYIERRTGDKGTLKMFFGITEENQSNSYISIYTPQVPEKKPTHNVGYSIFIDEALAIADKAPADQPANKK